MKKSGEEKMNGTLEKSRTLSILLVDDSTIIQDHINLLLSEIEGIEIVGRAGTVESAIEEVFSKNPDLIILDLHLRNENGLEVLAEIREKKMKTMVMVFTNYPYPSYRKACFQAGADFFFDKSLEFGEAIRVIADLKNQKNIE